MAEENDEIVIDLREVLAILKKRVLMIVGIAVVFLAVAMAYTSLKAKTPMYESIASVETPLVAREIFRSRSVVEPVIEKFLREDGKVLPSYESWVGANLKFTESKGGRYAAHKSDEMEYLKLAVTDTSPNRAQSMLEEIISLSRERLLEIKKEQLSVVAIPAEREENKSLTEQIEPTVFQNMMFIVIDKPSLAKEPMPQGRAKICAIALVLGIIVGCVSAVVKEKF